METRQLGSPDLLLLLLGAAGIFTSGAYNFGFWAAVRRHPCGELEGVWGWWMYCRRACGHFRAYRPHAVLQKSVTLLHPTSKYCRRANAAFMSHGSYWNYHTFWLGKPIYINLPAAIPKIIIGNMGTSWQLWYLQPCGKKKRTQKCVNAARNMASMTNLTTVPVKWNHSWGQAPMVWKHCNCWKFSLLLQFLPWESVAALRTTWWIFVTFCTLSHHIGFSTILNLLENNVVFWVLHLTVVKR